MRKKIAFNWLNILSISLLVLFPKLNLNAQKNIHDVLTSAQKKTYTAKLNYLENHSFRLPLFSRVSLRLNNEALVPSFSKYNLIFQNNSIWMMMAQKKTYQPMVKIEQLENEITYHQFIKFRYDALIDLYFTDQKKAVYTSLIKLLKDKKEVINQQIQMGLSTRIEDIFDADQEIQKLNFDQTENGLKNTEAIKIIAQLTGDNSETLTINLDDFISIDTVLAIDYDAINKSAASNPSLQKREQEMELEKWKMKLIKRSNYNVLNYWHVTYRDSSKKLDLIQNQITFGIGFNIPIPTNNKIKIQEAQLDYLAAEKKKSIEQINYETESNLALMKLKSFCQNYHMMSDQLNQFKQDYATSKLSGGNLNDPKLYVKIKIVEQRKELEKLDMQANLMKAYITYLSKIYQLGVKNHLTNQRESLN